MSKRQIEILESGGSIEQTQCSLMHLLVKLDPLRNKEEAHDYRYFLIQIYYH